MQQIRNTNIEIRNERQTNGRRTTNERQTAERRTRHRLRAARCAQSRSEERKHAETTSPFGTTESRGCHAGPLCRPAGTRELLLHGVPRAKAAGLFSVVPFRDQRDGYREGRLTRQRNEGALFLDQLWSHCDEHQLGPQSPADIADFSLTDYGDHPGRLRVGVEAVRRPTPLH